MKTYYLHLVLLAATLCSCSTISEEHYFKDEVGTKLKPKDNDYFLSDEEETVSNYYRVKVRGFSFLSSSRYVSGYFNQNAVNMYFNEIPQPENGKLFTPLVTNEDGNELILILSTNAKAITDQLGNVTKSQTILNSISQVVKKEKILEAHTVKTDIASTDQAIKKLIATTDMYLDKIDTKSDADINKAIRELTETLKK